MKERKDNDMITVTDVHTPFQQLIELDKKKTKSVKT